MNRRSFLKTTALAVVAVPVVGLPAMTVAKAVPKVWVIRFSRTNVMKIDGSPCHGTAILESHEQMLDLYEKLVNWDYDCISIKRETYTEARFNNFAATPSTARQTPAVTSLLEQRT